MKKRRFFEYNTTSAEKIVFTAVSVIFMIYALSLLYPFFYALMNSLNDKNAFLLNFSTMPAVLHFENYVKAFTEFNVYGRNALGMLWNSLVFTGFSTFLSVFMCALTSYCLAKYTFPCRNLLYTIAVIIMIIPTIGSVPSSYKLVSDLKIMDNVYLIPILYASGFGINFLLLYSFFVGISWNYAEAAEMDGCGNFRIFFRIMLPQAKPALIAVGIITAIGVWNDYMTPFLYLEHNPTLSYGLYYFNKEIQYSYNFPVLFAAIIINCIPLVVIFLIFQKTILENTVAGGLKG